MPTPLKPLLGLAVIAAVSWAWPATAHAHPQVDRGHELLEQAEFEQALSAFEQAEASGELSRAELLKLLEGRVMAHTALGQQGELQATLETLAAIDPGHELGPEVPPKVRSELARLSQEAGEAPSLDVRTEAAPEGLAVEAEVDNDDRGLVESVAVHARVADGSWRDGRGRVVVPAAEGDEVQYWAEAVGPGGAVIASTGSADEPLAAMHEPTKPAQPTDTAEDDGGGASIWLWVGVGAAVVAVAAAVGVGVAVAGDGGSNKTQPELPVVMGF